MKKHLNIGHPQVMYDFFGPFLKLHLSHIREDSLNGPLTATKTQRIYDHLGIILRLTRHLIL